MGNTSMQVTDELQFGLTHLTVQTLVHIFASHAKVQRALIYGSRAMGNFREGSDIDLALDAPDLTYAEKLAIDLAIADTNIPYLVDLSVMHSLTQADLLDHIERVGRVLYARGK